MYNNRLGIVEISSSFVTDNEYKDIMHKIFQQVIPIDIITTREYAINNIVIKYLCINADWDVVPEGERIPTYIPVIITDNDNNITVHFEAKYI